MSEFASLAQAVLNQKDVRYLHCSRDGSILACSPALRKLLPASDSGSLWEVLPGLDELQRWIAAPPSGPMRLCIGWPGCSPEPYLVAVGEHEFLILAEHEEGVRLKFEFLSELSHEIRTPLNTLMGMSHLMLKTSLSLKQREYMRHILGGCQALVRLVNEAFCNSNLAFRESEFRVRSWVEEICRQVQPEAQSKGLGFKTTIGPEVPNIIGADAAGLRQVLLGLIGTLMGFNKSGGVSLEIHFSISDTYLGQGVLECRVAELRSGFSELPATDTLDAYQQGVKQMGGALHVQQPGPDCPGCFLLVIPCSYRNSPVLATPLTHVSFQRPGGPTERVLIVEDNLANQRIVSELLGSYGILTEIAQNGREAVARAQACDREEVWRLILMDLQMPFMDGPAAAAAIRSLDKFDDVPILAMSAQVFPEEQERCLSAGMDGFLAKPLEPDCWLAVLGHWLPIIEISTPGNRDILEIEGFDTRAGRGRVAGNLGLYCSLLREFGRRIPELLKRITEAAKGMEWWHLRTLAHGLRGEAGNLGALELAELAAQLEDVLQAQDFQRASSLVGPLQDGLKKVEESLRQRLPHHEPLTKASRPLEPRLVEAIVEKLALQLSHCEGEATDTVQELWTCLGPLAAHPSADRLYRLVNEFEFGQASQALQELIKELKADLAVAGPGSLEYDTL